ncbi:glycoside hydrolase family protein [Endozoicomonas acroporae]|uniref:glycoside hydrolase family protein n=1 Tax=Endozoicomonas acroporae TaxID=1701104 RepID=UPI0013D8A117|nr:glycoside hydrolase family protein [Endozoicomonas acroporae]
MLHVYDLIKEHEGLRLKPYRCTAGKLTIGYGHNLDDNGITEDQAERMLIEDVANVEKELVRNIPWFAELDIVRQSILIDMAFNLGWPRLSKFKKTLAYIKSGEYNEAAMEMLDSVWANQVGERAIRLAEMMRTGEWPE